MTQRVKVVYVYVPCHNGGYNDHDYDNDWGKKRWKNDDDCYDRPKKVKFKRREHDDCEREKNHYW